MSHVAIVLPGFPGLGGAERQVLDLAQGLARRGWRITVVALSLPGGEPARLLTESGVEFLALDMKKGLADPRGWLRFHHWLATERPEILHAHLPHAAWFARWSRLASPVRVQIDTIHTAATESQSRRLGYRLSQRLPDLTTVVSQAAAQAWQRAGMVPAERLTVVSNGVDTQRFRPDAQWRAQFRAQLGLSDEFLWIAAGRLAPVKDFSTLLWAMAQLPVHAHLALAGAGPEEAELHALARRLGIEARVHWLGFVDAPERLYPAADGFVLSSLWEGLPVALLEAAACGLPAVATPVAGASEVIAEGQMGFLAATTGSAVALEEKMTVLMHLSASQRAVMGEAARTHIVANFSLEHVLNRWEALYSELLDRHPALRRWGSY